MFRLAVATGTRAEYGLLRPVLDKLEASPVIEPLLLVTGSHLAREYGHTIDEILADGRAPAACIDILSCSVPEGRAGTAARTVLALEGFLAWLREEQPDALLVLGDRYEIFAAGQAAALLGIPLAHISGGDVTQGADDDWFRHCLTKMARLHFPSCAAYARRLVRMGEAPATVHNVGGLGDENIRSLPLPGREELLAGLGLVVPGPYALVTYHPETATGVTPDAQADALLAALRAHPNLFYLITKSNADAGGQQLNERLADFCAQSNNAALFDSLGVVRYLAAMKHAALVLGNSSSGVVETPSFGVPAVDIGRRQAGRETGANVLHCAADAEAISAAIQTALAPAFTTRARGARSPYNGGDTSGKIVQVLEGWFAGGAYRQPKIFYDGE